ncbi:hypothetical protein ACNS7O_18965 (plasmid) [Haloferacaceae archaeon DSL9]
MPEVRHELSDEQYKELSQLKDYLGLTWKGLLLAGSKELKETDDQGKPAGRRLDGLTYSKDQRVFPDPKDDRLGSFKAGWTNAENGKEIGSTALDSLSWHNLGWRLGMLFNDASGELKREIYMWCVKRQLEAADEHPSTEK